MVAGVATGNPILVAGGALTYGGAVVYENREAIGEFAKDSAEYIGNKAGQARDAVVDTAAAVGRGAYELSSQAYDAGASAVSSVANAGSRAVSGVKNLGGSAARSIGSAWNWAFG